MNKINQPIISTESQADIYLQLAKLDNAGFSPSQTLELLLKTDKKYRTQLQQMLRLVNAGKSIVDSGYQAGIFSSSDKPLLVAGEAGGNMGIIYQQLADYYDQKAKRTKKIKSKCTLPLFILIIAIFLQPLPALILNEITGLDYSLICVERLFKIVLLFYILFNLPFWLTTGSLQFLGLKNSIFSLQLKLPLLSSWIIKRQTNAFFRSLGLMLTAGMPILTAFPKAINTIRNPTLRKQFDSVNLTMQQGDSLTDGLLKIPLVENQIIQVLSIGEKSGQLPKTMLNHVKIEQETIDLQEDLATEWIPRFFYILVCAWWFLQ